MRSKVFSIVLLACPGILLAGARFPVGSAGSFLERLQAENTRLTRKYSLPTSPVGRVPLAIADYHLDQGRFSLAGKAADHVASEFILHGDERGIYGWLAYRDRALAYEYTTDAQGQVTAEAVPLSKVLPVCDLHPPEGAGEAPEPASGASPETAFGNPSDLLPADSLTPHIGAFPGNTIDVLKLQSLPGAAKVWFIDYKLLKVAGSDTPKGQTKQDVWQTWQSLSAILSAFQVNVTTDPAVYAAAGVANSGIASMKDVSGGSSSCGINAFGTSQACAVNRYNNGYATGRILAHEVGHGLGLFHDGGDAGGEYFNGFPAFQWTPLMGNVWPGDRWANALYQLSKGEYSTATQKQDDWAVIGRKFPFRDDDAAAARPLQLQGSMVPAALNRGQIGRSNDSDTFTFRIAGGGGRASLRADRIEYMGGAMLDVEAAILDAAGRTVVRHNAPAARHAELNAALNDGDYTLVIKGGGEGTLANGFSNYSSVGFYAISGTLTSGVVAAESAPRRAGFRERPVLDGNLLKTGIPADAVVERITLHGIDGRTVFHSRTPVAAIDLTGLPAGLYWLKVESRGNVLIGYHRVYFH